MNTRTRSAARAKTEPTKEAPKVKEEPEEIVLSDDEEPDVVEHESEDDYESEIVTKASSKKKQPVKKQPSAKKETKSRTRKSEPKLVATKKEPKQEAESPDDVDEIEKLHYDLNEKEMIEVNRAFDMNRISSDEELLNTDGLRTAIRSLGFEPRGDEIKKLMKSFATKANKLNRDGFHKIMSLKYGSSVGNHSDKCGKDEISRVFNLLDLDKSGFITLENLKSIAKELNEDLNEEELMEMINEADTDGDNKIDKSDFQRIMIKTNLY